MAQSSYEGMIEVVAAPTMRDVPDWVCQAFVGMKLHGYGGVQLERGEATSLFGHKHPISLKEPEYENAYMFEQKPALEYVRTVNQQAYDWWKSEGFPQLRYFVFNSESCIPLNHSIEESEPNSS